MRGTGQTKAMVMALPANGACVVAHCASMTGYLKQMIFDIRGADVLKRTRVLAIGGQHDVSKLIGLAVPVFVDHAFWYLASARAREAVYEAREAIEARMPAAAA